MEEYTAAEIEAAFAHMEQLLSQLDEYKRLEALISKAKTAKHCISEQEKAAYLKEQSELCANKSIMFSEMGDAVSSHYYANKSLTYREGARRLSIVLTRNMIAGSFPDIESNYASYIPQRELSYMESKLTNYRTDYLSTYKLCKDMDRQAESLPIDICASS